MVLTRMGVGVRGAGAASRDRSPPGLFGHSRGRGYGIGDRGNSLDMSDMLPNETGGGRFKQQVAQLEIGAVSKVQFVCR